VNNRYIQDIICEIEKFHVAPKPVAAIISSVEFDFPGKTVFSNSDLSAKIMSVNKKSIICWLIYNSSVSIWKNLTEVGASIGVKEFIFIGKYFDSTLKSPAYIIKDHINVSGENPLTGPNDDALGTRFPDMTELYNINLSSRLKTCCEIAGISIDDAYLLVPKDLNTRTDLERKIISLRKELVFSKDVFAGAIVAKHQSIRSAGLLLCESVTKKQKDLLLKSILRMIS